jgi:tetratricopeptide (TPR) repeat protein
MARAIAFAETSNNAYDRAMALHFQGNLHVIERDADSAEKVASELLALASENGFSYLVSLAKLPLGWALARKGAAKEGVSLIRQTLADQAASGARVSIGATLNRLAEAQQLDGAPTEALATIEEALTANPQELVYRSESFRIRGGLHLQQGDLEQAEADLRMAIEVARGMGARVFELRAGIELAQLLHAREHGQEAWSQLGQIRAGFGAGADGPELRDADALLERLKPSGDLPPR